MGDFFDSYLETLYRNNNYSELEKLRYYTGYSFRDINALLRGKWNYEVNGLLTEEKRKEYMKLSEDIRKLILNSPKLLASIKTYRGASLSQFYSCGVTKLEDLINLKGQYLYDEAFTSTSLMRNTSFFNRDLEYHEQCPIEIEYLIPEGSNDGVPLITEDLSYSSVQNEYLINSSNFSKILDVVISEDKKRAYMKVLLVPEKVYNPMIIEEKSKEL